MTLSPRDRASLARAKALLEHPGTAATVTNLIGMPIERALALLPEKWADAVNAATRKSLETALKAALLTLDDAPLSRSREFLHKLAVAATGAGGGAFGLAGLPVELPLSTTIMLRSIADIARSEGESLAAPEGKLACLEVFALGGRRPADDATESAYFAVRGVLAKAISEAAQFITEKGVVEEGAPALRQTRRAGRLPIRRGGLREGCGGGRADRRRRRRGRDQPALHRPLSGHGPGTLHRPQARAGLWRGTGESRIRCAVAPARHLGRQSPSRRANHDLGRGQWHRCAGGTSRRTSSMWRPQPTHVGLPHVRHTLR